jgi:hypothetical protein
MALLLAVEDLALVGDRLGSPGQLAGQLLALLEVGQGAGEQEAEQEDVGGDEARVERVQLDRIPTQQVDGELTRESGGDQGGHPARQPPVRGVSRAHTQQP